MIRIIIPTLGKKHLIKCLEHIHKFTKTGTYKISLITEGSTWAEAVNIGINMFPNDDVILMDDDVFVTKNWLSNLSVYRKKYDIFSWSLKRLSGDMQFTGCYYKKNINNKIIMDNFHDVIKSSRETINTTTSCVFISRKVFDKIGILDNETYKTGCHYEDSDFCYRVVKAGFKIFVIPKIVVHGETFTKKDFVAFKEKVKLNGFIFYNKINSDKEYIKIIEERGFLL